MKRVIFDRPNLRRVRNEGLQAVDMHFHTKYSDTYTKVSSILKKGKKMGVGVAITDHNRIKGAVIASRMSSEMMIIPGIEVNCYEGAHILLYFNHMKDLIDFHIKHIKDYLDTNPYMATKIRVETLVDNAKDYNCLISAAHPFIPMTGGIQKAIDRNLLKKDVYKRVHAIEAINGNATNQMNLKAAHLALEISKPTTGGSDGHTLGALGQVVTTAQAETPEAFLEAIRKKQNSVIGKTITVLPRLASYSKNISKHLTYLIPSIGLKVRRVQELSIKKQVKPFLTQTADLLRDNPVELVKKSSKKIGKKVKDTIS